MRSQEKQHKKELAASRHSTHVAIKKVLDLERKLQRLEAQRQAEEPCPVALQRGHRTHDVEAQHQHREGPCRQALQRRHHSEQAEVEVEVRGWLGSDI